jgi:DNA-binding XRE family transcriptional regulator
MKDSGDFLEEVIQERTEENPAFRAMVEAARTRRRMLSELAKKRQQAGLSQTWVAAAMGTSQSSIARIEAGRADVRLSTVERYAAALGEAVEWRLRPA